MAVFRHRTVLPVSAGEAYAWHARPGAFGRLLPPWERIRVLDRTGEGLDPGGRVVLRVWTGPAPFRWEVEHVETEPGRSFVDRQVRGPFARWIHRHAFVPEGEGGSVVEDQVEYELPLDAVLGPVGHPVVRSRLERTFRFRHRRTGHDLGRHAAWSDAPSLEIAVTGASGLVGSHLSDFLRAGGHRVRPLVRRTPRPGSGEIGWAPADGRIDAGALEGVDGVVHLAGEPLLAAGWSDEKKARIRRSREEGTRLLAGALAGLDRPPRVLVTASGVNYYGDRGDEPLAEDAGGGEGFLADVCRAWEGAADPAREAGIRVVHGRFGLVVTAAGGALPVMLPPFRLGLGGPLGSGDQWMPWVSLDDLLGAILHALHDDAVAGPVNVVAPGEVTNARFTRTLGRVLGRPTVFRVPGSVLRAVAGEMAKEMLLASVRARPEALEEAGFDFVHPTLEEALRFELGRLP